jgi:hypothetical protein
MHTYFVIPAKAGIQFVTYAMHLESEHHTRSTQYMNNRRKVFPALAALVFSFLVLPSYAQPAKRIELHQIEAMFGQMRAKAPWNVDGPLLWGYFFFDPDPEKLKRAAAELESAGYRIVGIDGVPARKTSRLHVEKVEVHSPQSLHERNTAFYALAAKHALASYDGMDVGSPPK